MESKIEKLSDYKRAMKAFVRGAIKSKLFGAADGKLEFVVDKYDGKVKYVSMKITNGVYSNSFCVEVSTRVFNKVIDGFFDSTAAQFGKIKGITAITFDIVKAETPCCRGEGDC